MALGIIYGVSQGLIGCVSYSTEFHNPWVLWLGPLTFVELRSYSGLGFGLAGFRKVEGEVQFVGIPPTYEAISRALHDI